MTPDSSFPTFDRSFALLSVAAALPVLKTERLALRQPCRDDAAAIAALANDRLIAENTALIPHPYRQRDAERWIDRLGTTEDEVAFGLFARGGGALIGACGLTRAGKVLHLGYWLGAAHRNRGLATEAARAVIDFAFARLGEGELASAARVNNPASRRVLERCGFQWTGVGLMRISSLAASVPVDRFRLDRKSWASLRAWGALPMAEEAEVQAA